MRVTLHHRVAGVAPEEAARWWSDFREGGKDHRVVPGHRRRILEQGDGRVVMEDETRVLGLRIFHERTTAWPDGKEVRFAGRNNFALFDGVYAFEPDGEGSTRIVLHANVALRRALEWTDVAAKPLVAAILRADLALHANDMRRELKGERQGGRPGRA